MVHVHLQHLLCRNCLHKQALHQCRAQHRSLFELSNFASLPLEVGCNVFVDHENLSLTRANFFKHLILVKLNRTDTCLSLGDLALVAGLNSLDSLKSLLLGANNASFNLPEAFFFHRCD